MNFDFILWACVALSPVAGDKVLGTPIEYYRTQCTVVLVDGLQGHRELARACEHRHVNLHRDYADPNFIWVRWPQKPSIFEIRQLLGEMTRRPRIKRVIYSNPFRLQFP